MTRRTRRGFTLWEMTIVFAIMAVTALIVAPQWTQLGEAPSAVTGQPLLDALRDARRLAITAHQVVALRIDPASGRYRVDTSGVSGTGVYFEGELALGTLESIESDQPRLQFIFRPTGATYGDTAIVRSANGAVLIAVDPWSGVATSYAR